MPCHIDPGRADDEAGQYVDMLLANSDAYRTNYTVLEEAAALFAAHEAGASRTRLRKATGRTPAQVKAALAAGGLPAETKARAAELNHEVTLDDLALLAEFEVMWTPRGASVTDSGIWPWSDGGMHVVLERRAGVVTAVAVAEAPGRLAEAAVRVNRFLRHLLDSGCSPNTAAAYGYDLRYLLEFLDERALGLEEFGPAAALELLGWLRRRPSRRPAQRLGLALSVEQGRLLAPATVARVLAAVSSFFEWAISAEVLDGENPMQRRFDLRWRGWLPGTGRSPGGKPAAAGPPDSAGAVAGAAAPADDRARCGRAAEEPDPAAGPGDGAADAGWRAAAR